MNKIIFLTIIASFLIPALGVEALIKIAKRNQKRAESEKINTKSLQ